MSSMGLSAYLSDCCIAPYVNDVCVSCEEPCAIDQWDVDFEVNELHWYTLGGQLHWRANRGDAEVTGTLTKGTNIALVSTSVEGFYMVLVDTPHYRQYDQPEAWVFGDDFREAAGVDLGSEVFTTC